MTINRSIYNKPWLIATAHFLGWLLFFSFPFFMRSGHHAGPPPDGIMRHEREDGMLHISIVTNICLIGVFYLNMLWVGPMFTREKQYRKFLLMQAGVAAAYFIIMRGFTFLLFPDSSMFPMFMQEFNYILIVLVAFCYNLVKETMRAESIQKEKETETLRSELSFLRWQISPHFLFNVLNNMVSLARVRSEKLEGMLLDLSNLMRYMLYENDDRKVTVDREAEYLNSYIELQNVRFGNEVKLKWEVNVVQADSGNTIEPMLLIPFIENAFKHGTGIADPEISVVIHFDNNMATMTTRNRYVEKSEDRKDGTHGIGLANVKRRLNLLYPGKYSLDIRSADGWYISTLGINIG